MRAKTGVQVCFGAVRLSCHVAWQNLTTKLWTIDFAALVQSIHEQSNILDLQSIVRSINGAVSSQLKCL